MIRLFIENREVELGDSFNAPLTKTFENLENPTKIINDYSKTVQIPHTQKNDRLFGFLFNPDRLTAKESDTLTGIYFDPYQKISMRLEYNDSVLLTGYLKVLSVDSKGYNCSLNGELGKVFQDIKNQEYDFGKYLNGIISKELIKECWESTSNDTTLRTINDNNYKVSNVIGFFPNNALNSNFDYKSVEVFKNNKYQEDTFSNILTDRYADFKTDTGVSTDTAIGDGLTPIGYGEFRSWLQQPFIYFNQLFQIFQSQSEETTGYNFDLDSSWFNNNNPYWSKLAITCKGFPYAGASNTAKGNLSYSGTQAPLRTFTPTDYSESIGKFNMAAGSYTGSGDVDWTSKLTGLGVKVPAVIDAINIEAGQIDCTISVEGFISTDEVKLNPANGIYISVGYYTIAGEFKQSIPLWFITDKDSFLEPTGVTTVKVDSFKWVNGKHQITVTLPLTDTKVKSDLLSGDSYTIYYICSQVPSTSGRLKYKHIAGEWQYSNQTTVVYIPKEFSFKVSYEISEYRSGSMFSLNTLLGDANIFDIILNYCKVFRILITVDDCDKKLKFIPASTYFKNYTISKWDNKLDKTKDFTITPVTWENKYVLFDYKDDESALAKKYKEANGYNYGELNIETNYQFNTETTKLFESDLLPSIIYISSDLSWISLYGKEEIIYTTSNNQLVANNDENNKEIDNGFYKFVFPILNQPYDPDEDLRPWKVSDDTFEQAANKKYYYAGDNSNYAIAVSGYTMPSFTYKDCSVGYNTPVIRYSNDSFGTSIYNGFWANYIAERYNTQNKIVTCYLKLTPSDYANFDFNHFITIENQLYMVNKIYDYDITSTESTKVDLITIQNIDGYTNYAYGSELKVDTTTLYLYKYQDTGYLNIYSTSDWAISSAPNLTITPSYGSKGATEVKIKTNNLQKDTTLTLTNAQGDTQKINIIGKDSILTAVPNAITLNKKKDSKPVTITSTYDCDITYESLVAGFYASPTYVNAGVHQITLNSDLVTGNNAVVIITQKDGKTTKINVTFN